ncbi:MAG TPA: hypothetical protein VF266_14220, partial [Thermoanaerobaculia bacterium]
PVRLTDLRFSRIARTGDRSINAECDAGYVGCNRELGGRLSDAQKNGLISRESLTIYLADRERQSFPWSFFQVTVPRQVKFDKIKGREVLAEVPAQPLETLNASVMLFLVNFVLDRQVRNCEAATAHFVRANVVHIFLFQVPANGHFVFRNVANVK